MALPNRRTVRIPGYDYSQHGAYFITVCAQERKDIFGEIRNGVMCLNSMGALVWREWMKSFALRKECTPGAFVVMPNHWHGIIHMLLSDEVQETPVEAFGRPIPKSLASFVRGLKSSIASCAVKELDWREGSVCQSRYWEHVIRDEQDYKRIDEYIRQNPAHWQADCFHQL